MSLTATPKQRIREWIERHVPEAERKKALDELEYVKEEDARAFIEWLGNLAEADEELEKMFEDAFGT